jgi:hypothetical protein
MLKMLANTLIVGAVRKGAGMPRTGTLTSALLTTGASLLLVRGRRPVGFVLLAAGGLLLWRESEAARAEEKAAQTA